ncbi:hypothetical protein M3D75_14550 [Microbacterium enclense]|uniref:hypothetical protein n=1 Tax=Microbacterium enclense TaxID=993073 RepID=UPI0021A45BC3|nr:hypothetical protein [Microbacterium enclense]MCT2087340.1 hypothetical protein [Microbacterium enclense]
MSVKHQMGYSIACDFPGCGAQTRDLGDYGFWGDIGSAVDEWTDHDGYSGDLGDFCYEHTVWSDEDDEESDGERVPMEYTVGNLFVLAERRIAERIAFRERQALMRLGDRCREMEGRQASRRLRIEREWVRVGGVRGELALRLAAHP